VAEKTILTEPNTTTPVNASINAAKSEYSRRLAQRQARAAQLHIQHVWLGNLRIAVFVGIIAFWLILGRTGSPSKLALYSPLLLFVGLVIAHRRVVRSTDETKRAIAFYERGIARIEDRWAGSGRTGDEFKDPLHLYAEDLDILGAGSLYQLLSTARTKMGSQCLAQWLLTHASISDIQDRQLSIAELKDKLDFREDLAVVGKNKHIEADPELLGAWAREESALPDGRWWAAALAIISVATLVYGIKSHWTPFVLSLLINGGITYYLRARLEKILAGVSKTHLNLDSLSDLLKRLEAKQFNAPQLQQLHSLLSSSGLSPSACIKRLDTLSDLDDSRHNWFVALLDIPLLYTVQLAFALERWRRKYGSGIEAWLRVVGEIEALSSIAAYAYEHPEDVFPEFAPAESIPGFEGEALGHPLLPADQCVRNNVTLGGKNQVLIISGSNMSGKSTYMRVIGINAVLAMMGAPVRAKRLRLSRVAIGASMRVSDSLQKGISHFYAEIKRLRQVVDLSSAQPTLFLLDEVLHGTNSHDRRVGTEGVLRTLIHNAAIGMVTTHDLALTSLEEVFPDQVRNAHFQERFEDDRLSFDYCLRPGVVTTSNGLELMKSIGLDVPDQRS
jgi:MutS domain V